MSETKWKEFFLKSGIPLEHEIINYLDKRNCFSHYEYSYLRTNEQDLINEFSYDIQSRYKGEDQDFDLMIECKYKDKSTNWFFMPEWGPYLGDFLPTPEQVNIRNHGTTSFLHRNDFFIKGNKTTKDFNMVNYNPIAPISSKGIEITSSGNNETTITRAKAQLSYAYVDRVIHEFRRQLFRREPIFTGYIIPVIVTTANLYRVRENITIDDIEKAKNPLDISTKEDIILLQNSSSNHLKNHAKERLRKFSKEMKTEFLNSRLIEVRSRLTFEKIMDRISGPSGILVIQYSKESKGFDKLFNFMDEILNPTTSLNYLNYQEKVKEVYRKMGSLG